MTLLLDARSSKTHGAVKLVLERIAVSTLVLKYTDFVTEYTDCITEYTVVIF